MLLLSASPWGDVEKIINKRDQSEVAVTEDQKSTPSAIRLAPGEYSVTVSAEGASQTIDVEINAGQPTKKFVKMREVDVDALVKDVTRKQNP